MALSSELSKFRPCEPADPIASFKGDQPCTRESKAEDLARCDISAKFADPDSLDGRRVPFPIKPNGFEIRDGGVKIKIFRLGFQPRKAVYLIKNLPVT
jgi:hypothetical protein